MAPPVTAAAAVRKDVPLYDEFSGRLDAVATVEVRSRVAGTLDKVHFADGQDVKQGALLFSIDARPFGAELARQQAQLASVRSSVVLAEAERNRALTLVKQNMVSRQAVDQADANLRAAQAAVHAAEAAVASAKLNVSYAQIKAPIDGRASRANVTAGNLVSVGDPVLTTLVALDRVYAWFDVNEAAYLRTQAALNGPTRPKVEMALSDESGFPHLGSVDFVDNRINAATGSIRMRAVFENKDRRFMPGLFARVRLAVGAAQAAILIPDRAIGTDQSKRFVFVVGADRKALFREVKLGPLIDGMRVISEGLAEGDLVVVNGLQRVRPGAPVEAQVLKVDERGMPIEAPPPAKPGGGAAPGKT
jgi:RND family efflux transporter MFP subunit